MLVAHDQDVMLGEGAIERGAGFGIDRLGEIDAGDFGAGVIGQRRDGEGRHGKSSHAVFVCKTLSPDPRRVKEPPIVGLLQRMPARMKLCTNWRWNSRKATSSGAEVIRVAAVITDQSMP